MIFYNNAGNVDYFMSDSVTHLTHVDTENITGIYIYNTTANIPALEQCLCLMGYGAALLYISHNKMNSQLTTTVQ